MGCFLITGSGKVMTQGLAHLLWSCCPSPPHPSPFFGKCRVSGTDRGGKYELSALLESAPIPRKMRTQRSVDGMSNSSTPCTAFMALMTTAKHVEFLGLKCNILLLILLILLLTAKKLHYANFFYSNHEWASVAFQKCSETWQQMGGLLLLLLTC